MEAKQKGVTDDMGKCAWCGKMATELEKVMSLGNSYNICAKCKEAFDNEECIKCGEQVTGSNSIKGMCYGCSQDEYDEQQRKIEEMANGVASEQIDTYLTEFEFTEADYERWVTFGQGNFSPAYRKKCRHNWIRAKLVGEYGWSAEIVEGSINEIESLLERYMSKVIDKRYKIVYYDPSNKGQRIRQFVDRIGNIFIVEVR